MWRTWKPDCRTNAGNNICYKQGLIIKYTHKRTFLFFFLHTYVIIFDRKIYIWKVNKFYIILVLFPALTLSLLWCGVIKVHFIFLLAYAASMWLPHFVHALCGNSCFTQFYAFRVALRCVCAVMMVARRPMCVHNIVWDFFSWFEILNCFKIICDNDDKFMRTHMRRCRDDMYLCFFGNEHIHTEIISIMVRREITLFAYKL